MQSKYSHDDFSAELDRNERRSAFLEELVRHHLKKDKCPISGCGRTIYSELKEGVEYRDDDKLEDYIMMPNYFMVIV